MSVAILMMQSGSAIGGMIGDRAELEAILGDSLVLEDFESVELNFPTPPLTPELWTGPVLDSEVGIVDGIVFTREPPGNLTVQDPLLLGGNQVLKTNSGAIAIDFLSPVPAFGFDFVRPTNTQTEVTLNVYAEDDVTILATETITLYFNGFIGFSELGGIGKATVSSFSVSLPSVTETRIDNVTFGFPGSADPIAYSGKAILCYTDYTGVQTVPADKGKGKTVTTGVVSVWRIVSLDSTLMNGWEYTDDNFLLNKQGKGEVWGNLKMYPDEAYLEGLDEYTGWFVEDGYSFKTNKSPSGTYTGEMSLNGVTATYVTAPGDYESCPESDLPPALCFDGTYDCTSVTGTPNEGASLTLTGTIEGYTPPAE